MTTRHGIRSNVTIHKDSENSRHLATPQLVSPPNDVRETSTEIPYLSIIIILMTRHYPDVGSDASSVWNFCARFSDVIWQGNQW